MKRVGAIHGMANYGERNPYVIHTLSKRCPRWTTRLAHDDLIGQYNHYQMMLAMYCELAMSMIALYCEHVMLALSMRAMINTYICRFQIDN